MRIILFYHSLISCWNNGNAHFLRGVVAELKSRGHDVTVFEPRDGWSYENLRKDHGGQIIASIRRKIPGLQSERYRVEELDLDRALDQADLVIVHEWNDPDLIRRIGRYRVRHGHYRLLFHDTHHLSATKPEKIASYGLGDYDGVLAFGEAVREIYLKNGWCARVWTWHEAADTRIFRPLNSMRKQGDLVWIGNWGDEERTTELTEYLLAPARDLSLKTQMYGVRYPAEALECFKASRFDYGGWLPNHRVPQIFARFKTTVHIPRRPYVQALPGIPTIRVFEALACKVPLVVARLEDPENLFTPGEDFLIAHTGEEMKKHLWKLVHDQDTAQAVAQQGYETVLRRHTCKHRADELIDICRQLGLASAVTKSARFGQAAK